MEITLGQVVYSKAGRDADRKYVIIGIVDNMHVLIVDGDLRRLEKPKKKKIRHLTLTGEVIGPLSEKLVSKMKVTNADIRKYLSEHGKAEDDGMIHESAEN